MKNLEGDISMNNENEPLTVTNGQSLPTEVAVKFESYMIVGPILTIISTMVVFGLQIVKEGWLFNPHFYVDNFYFNHRRNDIFHSSPCYDSKTRKIFRNC